MEIDFMPIEDCGPAYYAKGHHNKAEFIAALLVSDLEREYLPDKIHFDEIKHQHLRYARIPDDLCTAEYLWMQTRKPGRGAMKVTIFYTDGEMGFHGDW